MRTRGRDFGGLRGCAGNQSAGGCLVCRGYARPRHPMRTAPSLASGGERPAGAPNGQQCGETAIAGLTAQPLARLAQRAGADGFIVLPRQCQPSTSATFTMERSLSKATPNTSQSACSMAVGLRSVAVPSSARPVQSTAGVCCFERHPIVQGLANSWVSFRYSCSSIGYRLTSMAKAQLIKPAL